MMTGILFDTNVLLDIATNDPVWFSWSDAQMAAASGKLLITVNAVTRAELTPAFDSEVELDAWLNPNVFQFSPIPKKACWLAGVAFRKYRRAGGTKTRTLPDFFIGAHAESDRLTIVTRDPKPYRTYFPSVPLITP